MGDSKACAQARLEFENRYIITNKHPRYCRECPAFVAYEEKRKGGFRNWLVIIAVA